MQIEQFIAGQQRVTCKNSQIQRIEIALLFHLISRAKVKVNKVVIDT